MRGHWFILLSRYSKLLIILIKIKKWSAKIHIIIVGKKYMSQDEKNADLKMFVNKKTTIIAIIVIVLVVGYFVFYSSEEIKTANTVNETLTIPDTKELSSIKERTPTKGAFETKLFPENEGEKVIVPNADLTLKGSYDVALAEAKNWSGDAKLIFIKSQGAITADGKSSQWQVAFGSEDKGRGYEIIVRKVSIVSQKEIESTEKGFDLPLNWYDSPDALAALKSPENANMTASTITFDFNLDGNKWSYIVATSNGITSVPVR